MRLACLICNRQLEARLKFRQGELPLPSSSSSSSKAPAAASLRAASNRAWKTAPTASWALPDTTPPEPCLHPRLTSLPEAAKFWDHAPNWCFNTVSSLGDHASMSVSALGDHASMCVSSLGDHASVIMSSLGDHASMSMSSLGDHASMIVSSLGDHANLDMSSFGDHVSMQCSGVAIMLLPQQAQQAQQLLWYQIKRTETCSVAQPVWYTTK